ncbi:DUF6300 family protein [Streptomyces californicus]|uniref:DUF6300 family protein n=1 Tax=Streptomyces californicus TaxID=67351 RepID=UPI00296E76D6|nr:DUF6300 family protein [Streptomyces californicus]MDW4917719.1 DUF6300 family protein [Streptomyces californicus]
MSNEPAPVVQLDDVPPCRRCDRPGLMLTRFPNSWKNQRGEDVTGVRAMTLCSTCDAADPAAAPLLALFDGDGKVAEKDLARFTELAADWTADVAGRKVNEEDLAAEEELFRRDEL